ncbi:MAG: E3 binding domain-containing protein [Rubrobacteraceae bacterium]|nr:E3 binding domain-containing protein [Rubrobacteraceae bacterium]
MVEITATDAARRKAREMGVDLSEVVGTGTDGQVTVEDVRKKGES